ncbi:integrase catalytic domain-containing protein [Trichonephila clavipes]|nr:integrase catalytic domain-containing protein [Trichonephila clavipes]
MKIQLSDVWEESRSIQVLLGSDVIGKLMTDQRRILSCGLVAMESILGWTLSDPSEQKTKEELHKASMEHFLRTVKVDKEERFFVSLPWLDNHLPLPDNFNLAFKGLQVTTHKLKKETCLSNMGDVFKEWKREGIIEEVPKEELKSFSHYLPHRYVVKPDSTTKIRPVFNASSKQKGAVSLNDSLEKGLNLIELIPSIEEGELIHYRQCRVVFGVSSSPFLLGSTIQYYLEKKLEAKQGRGKYPECIVQNLMSSFYVDNCLASVQNQSELDRFIDVATEIMAERKFDLRGWEHSNPSDPIASLTNVLGMI